MTIQAAVLGSPVAHSLSPLIHNKIYQELGIDGEYIAIETKSGELSRTISERKNWSGFSVTMPLKEEAFNLATIHDQYSERSKSANTLIFDQHWSCFNTDVLGFQTIFESLSTEAFESVLILGNGGTAKAALLALEPYAKDLSQIRRSSLRDEQNTECFIGSIKFIDWKQELSMDKFTLVINTLPLAGILNFLQDHRIRTEGTIILDALYSPWPPPFTSIALERGVPVIFGYELLVHQGIRQAELMLKIKLERNSLAEILLTELKRVVHSR
jgi:shikimate dehydrogenase